jgi:hypothetical protein
MKEFSVVARNKTTKNDRFLEHLYAECEENIDLRFYRYWPEEELIIRNGDCRPKQKKPQKSPLS